ncbi:hypothetical protein Dtox_2702 [Desulfofarcimen acetoxidans DSM 771]|uniref:Type 4 fimbrial biogenesis protein PilX N-terminal domain-containing protein n=1 Tax=Desulfofarcimen acetoxidans (strain ATCC 49208 / DSM 771 / KCTC 5769 / VKM B-1644 / 5575) TaxID=485916 RepID=C8W185_DESAS|nr:hypothetical protein [Desulfofarcimen acetoxidans]ACV63481.1 hypothetical protein Dtox_2702 [Desulfofarcimen acetoxidans DSM 771]
MKDKFIEQSGQVLLMSVFAVVMLTTLLLAAISLAGTGKDAAYLQLKAIQAAYIADAGLEKMLARLKYDKRWNNPQSIAASYAGGSISGLSISTDTAAGCLILTAKGSLGSTQKTLTAKLNFKPAEIIETYNNYIIAYCDEDKNLTENIALSPPLINDEDKSVFKTLAESYGSGHCLTGDIIFDSSKLQNMRGLYFIEGNVSIGGSYRGVATIIATGDIYINTSLITASLTGNSLALLSYSNINLELSDSETVVNAVLWSEDSIKVSNDSRVIGAVLTGDILLNGNKLNYQFSGELVNQLPPGLPVYVDIIYWKELYPVF